jgi:geranylgeranyl diphosphate synthase type I
MQNLFLHSEKVKQEILEVLKNFYIEDGQFPLAREFYGHMKKYTTSGKLFRGCFFLEMSSLLQKNQSAENDVHLGLVRVAAGLELISSGLLVHDDIMDHDVRRRGLLTTHTALADWAELQEATNPIDFGNSAAVCFGDVLFFLGSNCFAHAQLPAERVLAITQLSNHELTVLGLAQTEDLRLATIPIADVTEEEIVRMQYGKTGRYTGRWPLQLAATVSGLSALETEKLGRIGDEIGLLYQWRDDYLGLFGDPQKTGKNVLSDISEGKKTLYYWYAWHTLEGKQKQLIEKTFGNPTVSLADVSEVIALLKKSDVVGRITTMMETKLEKTLELVEKTQIPEVAQELLSTVLQLVISREK